MESKLKLIKDNKVVLIVAILVIVVLSSLFIRFFLGGDEDTWICTNGQWTRHGNPSSSTPTSEYKLQ